MRNKNRENHISRARGAQGMIIRFVAAVLFLLSYSTGLTAREIKNFKQKNTSVDAPVSRGAMDQRRSVEELRASRKTEKNPLLRRKINDDLARQMPIGVEKDLLDSLKNDADPQVRIGAAGALGNYSQNRFVVEALAETALNDVNSELRYAAVRSLGLSKSFRSMRTLEKLMENSNPLMRREVAYALKRQKSIRAKILLNKLANDSDATVRKAAQELR